MRPRRSSIRCSENPARDESVAVNVPETNAHFERTAGKRIQGNESGPVSQTSEDSNLLDVLVVGTLEAEVAEDKFESSPNSSNIILEISAVFVEDTQYLGARFRQVLERVKDLTV